MDSQVTAKTDATLEPWMSITTPASVLRDPPGKPVAAGDRVRYSTCPGLAWFPGDRHLVTANYLGRFLAVYEVDLAARRFRSLQRLDNAVGAALGRAADVTVSRDGRTVAVGNSGDRLNVYAASGDHPPRIEPTPASFLGRLPQQRIHGVAFSADAEFLAYTTIDDADQVVLYRVERDADGGMTYRDVQLLDNPCPPLKPKSIAFSHDGRTAAICYSMRSSRDLEHLGRIVTFAFDADTGRIDPAPRHMTDPGAGLEVASPEGMIFTHDDAALLVTDQVLDRVTAHAFARATTTLGAATVVLENPAAQLSFPHGLAQTSDGRFLAVTSLGEDKITIYRCPDQWV